MSTSRPACVVELHHRVTDNPKPAPTRLRRALGREGRGARSVTLRLRPCRGTACPSISAFMAPFMRGRGWTGSWISPPRCPGKAGEGLNHLMEAADARGVRGAFLHALILVRDWLGVPLDHPDLAAHGDHARVERLKWLLGRLYSPTEWYDSRPARLVEEICAHLAVEPALSPLDQVGLALPGERGKTRIVLLRGLGHRFVCRKHCPGSISWCGPGVGLSDASGRPRGKAAPGGVDAPQISDVFSGHER